MTLTWGRTPDVLQDNVIQVSGLGAAVCADGANGLHVVSPREAEARGLHVEPGQALVPLVAYHPDDEGPKRLWKDGRTKPKGLDAPENLTGPKVVQTDGPGAGSYRTATALVNGRFAEEDPRRYFDSTLVCGWVLPGSTLKALGVGLGDLAAVTYNGKTIWAQAYDVGPEHSERLELSVEACRQLGIDSDARNGGTAGGVSISILVKSRRMTAEDGKIRPWTRESAGGIAKMAEWAYRTSLEPVVQKALDNIVQSINRHTFGESGLPDAS